MYNRYVPGHNGVYERHVVPDHSQKAKYESADIQKSPPVEVSEKAKQQHRPEQPRQSGLDLGDLLLLCIIILLLIDSDGEDIFPILIMAAAFLLQQ